MKLKASRKTFYEIITLSVILQHSNTFLGFGADRFLSATTEQKTLSQVISLLTLKMDFALVCIVRLLILLRNFRRSLELIL